MLAPRDRRLLLDALRPAPGYCLDCAVGTSFSLDLLALLTAPLAFTFFDWEDEEGAPTADPLALLEAVRRHADRITLFCQAGRIAVPRPGQILLGYLEGSVVEAAAPAAEGAFHPKVWVLRFTGDSGPVHYRVLCLSRNLTFDRSWDTALVLDGALVERTRAFGANRPLGDFLAALPDLSVRPLEEARRAEILRMADEVRRVRFELPEDVEEVAFWPLGIPGHRRLPIPEGDRRLLIVSPFVSAPLLGRLAQGRPPGILVSRPESLEALPRETLARFAEVFVLSPGADVQGPEDEGEEAATGLEEAGLHAKLFVLDDGWDARVWTGSANATTAAFGQNVELLVELVGKKSRLGIDSFLGDGDPTVSGMRALLQPFRPAGEEPRPASSTEELEGRLDALRGEIASWRLAVRVEAKDESSEFALLIEPGDRRWPAPPEDAKVRLWPTSLPPARALPVAPGGAEPLRFDPVSFEAITAFVAAEVTLRGPEPVSASFVLNLPILGAPEDRRERLLRTLLKDRAQVLRLLYLLLSDGPVSVQALLDATSGEEKRPSRRAGLAEGFPLLEVMLAALARDRARLDDVAKLIEDLRRTPEGRALLPEGLDSIWDPIWSARQEGSA